MKLLSTMVLGCLFVLMSAGAWAQYERRALTGTQVSLLPKCPVSGAGPEGILSVVAAAVVPKAIEVGVDVIAELLTEAGKQKDKTVTASTNGYFYRSDGKGRLRPHSDLGCVVVVHGPFGGDKPSFASSENRGAFESMQLSGSPNFYFEANVEHSKEGSGFQLKPQAMFFGKAIDKNWFSSSRDLVVTFAFRRGLEGSEKGAFGTAQFVFENVKENSMALDTEISFKSASWLALHPLEEPLKSQIDEEKSLWADFTKLPVLQDQARKHEDELAKPPPAVKPLLEDAIKRLCVLAAKHEAKDPECPSDLVNVKREVEHYRAKESQLRALNEQVIALKTKLQNKTPVEKNDLAPITVRVTLTETRQGNEYLLFAGKVLSAAKDDLKTGLKQELIPVEREKARNAEEADRKQKQAAQDALDLKALEALQAVETAEVALANAPADLAATERKKLELAVPLAKMKANIAYKAAGRNEPYPGIF